MTTIQEALSYGERMCADEGLHLTDRNVVWQLLVEAAETERSIPDRERTWLRSADRSGMPEAVHTKEELWESFATEVERIRCGLESNEVLAVKGPPPSAAAIDRWMVVMQWYQHVKGKNRRRNRGILFSLAGGASGDRVARIAGLKHRNSVYGIRDAALGAITRKIYEIAESDTHPIDKTGKYWRPAVHA